jgi:hypothetical protein
MEFQFLRPRGCLTNRFRALSLRFGVINKYLFASAIAIMCWQEVSRSSLCSGVKDCGTKCAHNFLFPKSSFRMRRTTVLGMFIDSAIILMRFDGHFFYQISNSSNVNLSLGQFWAANPLITFYQLPSVLKSIIPSKNF